MRRRADKMDRLMRCRKNQEKATNEGERPTHVGTKLRRRGRGGGKRKIWKQDGKPEDMDVITGVI